MFKIFIVLVLRVPACFPAGAQTAPPDTTMIRAAKELIARIVPAQSDRFAVGIIPPENGKDVFEIESRDDKILLRGNDPVSVASAFNWYLKYYAHCQLSWNGDNLKLPDPLPPVKGTVRRVSPYEHRVYLNYCTFSYTMAWWDWRRWQREIDWMAMHGINMPLAVTGQQAVWYNTLKKFRMNDHEIRRFLVGPAYFAWQWMTNIEGWGGPLPKSWIDSHVKLERKILARERALGMTPILQGFTGYVPKLLKTKYPDANIQVKGDWFGVPPGSGQLDPLDPLFEKIGKTFLEEEIKLFGTGHYYAADPFHEGRPPVKGEEYLEKVGTAIYKITSEVDSQAIIAMQTWSMRKPIVQAVPKDRILMLDLNSSRWKGSDAFWGRPWVAGIIHNFGGRIYTGGNLEHYATNAPSLLNDPAAGNLAGIGLFPEATGQNPVVYELAAEMAWRRETPALDSWVQNYARARYGSLPSAAAAAWEILQRTVYGQKMNAPAMESPVCATPALHITKAAPNGDMKRDYDPAELWKAWKDLLAAGETLQQVPTYRYDLVDVARQCLADLSLPLQKQVTAAYLAKDKGGLQEASRRFLELMDDMDRLLATQPGFLLGRWIADARRWGHTKGEKDLYEKNARTLITTWGPVRPDAVQYDYSNRQWSGLIKGYYKKRWEMFLHYLQEQPEDTSRFTQDNLPMSYGRPSYVASDFYKKLAAWEKAWTEGHEQYPDTPSGNPLAVAGRLYEKWLPVAHKKYDAAKAPVTLVSLLKEMAVPDALTRFPDPAYRSMQASSYNRASKSRDEKGWFADSDGTGYIREEENNGRKEYVIMEHTGPGCITRMWTPFFYYDLNNHAGPNIRIYIDGKPVITANFIALLTGRSFIKPPFASFTTRAGVAYLPVPFAKSCKITLDQKPFYYCINFRSYPGGTPVSSFSQKEYDRAGKTLRETAYTLLHPDEQAKGSISRVFPVQLRKNDSVALTLPAGPAAICRMQFTLDKAVSSAALRNVGLKITFDGQQTVWCPLGSFFCSVNGLNDFQTRYMTVSGGNTMVSRWVMPYRKSARIELVNFSGAPVALSLEVQGNPRQWDEHTMYFHAGWRDYGYLPGDKFFDLNFVSVKGKGLLAGDALTVLSPGTGWWGEGDEKIYVDRDIRRGFPSHFGTGTEDYYGWAGGEVPTGKDTFSIPFGANVKNGNAENPRGYNICTRNRLLDAIPFNEALQFDMEASPGVDIRHDYNLLAYSMVTYWYGLPGAVSNSQPAYDKLKRPPLSLQEMDILEQQLRSGVHR